MSAKSILLWVSCLALALLSASCSSSAGSPIQSELNAPADGGADVVFDDAAQSAELPDASELLAGGDGKSASYTPGLPCAIGAGASFPSPLNYGWRGGMVVDAAASVKLSSPAGAPLAWNIYAFQEFVAGRLQQIQMVGSGKQLAVFLYNWNTAAWDYMGTYNLILAAPTSIAVGPQHAPNGTTFMALIQLAPAETTVNRLRTNVF